MNKTRFLAFLLLLVALFSFVGCGEEEAQRPIELYTYTVMGEGENATVAISKYMGKDVKKVVVPQEYNGMPVTTVAAHCYSYHTEIEEITVPSGITTIGDFAFQACKQIKSVVLPDSVKTVGQGAFAECTALKTITLSKGISVIAERTFADTGLESISLGENIKRIEKYAFERCGALKSIVIPETVTSFGDGVFSDCTGILDMTFGQNVIEGGFRRIFSMGEAENSALPQPEEITVTSGERLPRDIFSGCVRLKRITLPDSITDIGEMALMNCLKLTDVRLPQGLKVLRESVFQNCESLQSITLPEGMEEIEIFSFAGCLALREVFVPASVKRIDEMVFEDASLLAETVIVCPKGSAMEEYARENGISCRNS